MGCKNCNALKRRLDVANRSRSANVSRIPDEVPNRDEIIDATSERDRVLQAFASIASASADFIRASRELDPNDEKSVIRWSSKFSFFERFWSESLDKAGVSSLDLAGQEYSPGLQVEAINLDDFEAGDALVIDEVLKPLLVYRAKTGDATVLLQLGRVTVKRKGE